MQPIEIYLYEHIPNKPGYVRRAGTKTVQQVSNELVERLQKEEMMPEEYFNLSADEIARVPFPEHRWISCFAVRGDSEGHYIHVEAIFLNGQRKLLFLGKTFQGLARAQAIANACGAHLEY